MEHASDSTSRSEASLDPESTTYANEVAHRLQAILGDDLVGVYLHGSAVLGDFSREQSDIDIVAVVERSLSAEEKKTVAEKLSSNSLPSPAGGLEFHIVKSPARGEVLDAPLFELHIATNRWGAQDRVIDGHGHAGDPDLVMHYATLSQHGHALIGPPASEIFPRVGREKLMKAFADDLEWAKQNAPSSYQVLNAARVWRFLEEGVLGSKLEGGAWARRYVEDPSVIDAAVEQRRGRAKTHPDPVRAKALLEDVLRKLERS